MKRFLCALGLLLASVASGSAAERVPFIPVTQPLLNIDFGAHLNPAFPRSAGPLAIGKSAEDFWNLYSRDGATMYEFLADNSLANLAWSDGAPSEIRVEVRNAAGAWTAAAHHDPAFFSYLYPLGGGPDISVELSNLPAGTYDLYFYAHADDPSANSVVQLATSSGPVGEKATAASPDWDRVYYTETNHYVRFEAVPVLAGEKMLITVKPGVYGTAFMNAMQLVWRDGTVTPVIRPTGADLFDLSQGAVITAHSGAWPASEIEAMFGSANPGVEPGQAIFQDNQPDGFVHFVEWRTAEPIRLESFRLFAAGDGPALLNEREFGSFVLKAKSPGAESFDTVVYSYVPAHPYAFIDPNSALVVEQQLATPLAAQFFRAEFVQRDAGRGYDGPRIIELDGFGVIVTNRPVIVAQPVSAAVPAGGSASFEVSVTGAEPMRHQWYFNGALLLDATNRTLSLTNAGPAYAGTYRVRIENQEGSAVSLGAVLSILGGPAGGTVDFKNFVPGRIDAPIRGELGQLLSGSDYLAQLYAGPSLAALEAVGAAVPVGEILPAGYFDGGLRTIPGVDPGSPAVVQVRAWAVSAGIAFDEAVAKGGPWGRSEPFAILLGGGGLPPAQLTGLAGFSLLAVPKIVAGPKSQAVDEGRPLELTVSATGGALVYQWFFNGAAVPNATGAAFSLSGAALTNTGSYTVEIRNELGKIMSAPALVTVREVDRQAPVIAVTSPDFSATYEERVTLSGTVADNVGVVSLVWERNRIPMGNLPLSGGAFRIANVPLAAGSNVFILRARDAAGNTSTSRVSVLQQARRAIYLPDRTEAQEGASIDLPIFARSEGDISAITFLFRYPEEYLADPVFRWASEPAGVLAQVNAGMPGQIRASFALPGATWPAGTNLLATVTFRVRSVPRALVVSNRLDLLGVYGADGSPLPSRTDALDGSVAIARRDFTGDNNANDRLDIGDASAIMRFVTLLEVPRAWDIAANDLNQNNDLDAGDVIRVLRTVVELDPQPALPVPGAGALAAQSVPAPSNGQVSISLSAPRLAVGEKVTARVRLSGRAEPLSGVSFLVKYPPGALRLESADAIRFGSGIPAGAVSLWNLTPGQNDFALQDGTLVFAAASPEPWGASNGDLLELTFQVRSAAVTQPFWNLTLSQIELTDGWEVSAAPAVALAVPVAGAGPVLTVRSSGSGALSVQGHGEPGVLYQVESSPNLLEWAPAGGAATAGAQGAFESVQPLPDTARFFRARRAE